AYLHLRAACGLFLAACASGPKSPRPDDMSAAAHRNEALRERGEAREHLSRFDPHATTAMPAENNERYITTAPPERPGYYNPTSNQLEAADAHLRHAQEHERAAKELERFEEKECRALEPEVRAACPLIRHVTSIKEIAGGARIYFAPDAAVNTA